GASLAKGPSSTAAAATVSALPPHFSFGLSAHPDSGGLDGWMPQSGVPWDYAYQYLSGGVNTGGGWATWSSSGTFALNYASDAASHGYIPVFTYYQLLQSNGPGGADEAQTDLANLNSASTMASYYQDFALLMKRLGPGNYNSI